MLASLVQWLQKTLDVYCSCFGKNSRKSRCTRSARFASLTPWFMTRWCTTVIAWWELCFLFALLSQFPLIYDEPCAALAGCWSCFSWCSSSSSQGVPGILTSKISLRNKESRGCKERKKKVKCTTFQIHLSVFWKIMRLKNALLWSKIRERDSLFSQDLVQLS